MSDKVLQTFQIDNPLQLLLKLGWNIKKLNEAIRSSDRGAAFFPSVYLVFDCAITAWQVSDWIYGFYSPTEDLPLSSDPTVRSKSKLVKFQAWACEQCASVRVVKHLANSNKHYGVDRKPDHSLRVSVEWTVESEFRAGSTVGAPLVDRSYKFVINDSGRRVEALQVFKEAFEFWALQIKEPSLIAYLDENLI